jgi:hypothetical protein
MIFENTEAVKVAAWYLKSYPKAENSTSCVGLYLPALFNRFNTLILKTFVLQPLGTCFA